MVLTVVLMSVQLTSLVFFHCHLPWAAVAVLPKTTIPPMALAVGLLATASKLSEKAFPSKSLITLPDEAVLLMLMAGNMTCVFAAVNVTVVKSMAGTTTEPKSWTCGLDFISTIDVAVLAMLPILCCDNKTLAPLVKLPSVTTSTLSIW